jgi:hypothetical protein
MTRSRCFLLLCLSAAVVVGSLAIAANPGGGEADPGIENTLAIQKAVMQARDYLMHSEARKAVEVLEANLPRINGDRKYLSLLRDAYRAHVKDLSLANQPAQAEIYQKRLKILEEHEASQEAVASLATAPPRVTTSGDAPKAGSAPPQVVAADIKPMPQPVAAQTVRAKPDPFAAENEMKPDALGAAKAILAKAEAEFGQKHYGAARQLYEQAFQAEPKLATDEGRKRWAYCQLAQVVDQVNHSGEQPCDWAKLETAVKTAVAVAPHLSKAGADILADIAKRRGLAPAAAVITPTVVKHLPRGDHGWLVAETSHFRVFHNQTERFAEQVAQTAERTRVQMAGKWFGKASDEWQPKCDIYLHATSEDYSKFTGQNASSPGYSRIDLDPGAVEGRVTVRQIHLRCDNPSLMEAVLPHETTHIVLAGQFGNKHVPRWVDEGVAVLTEPNEKVDQHRKNLVRSLQSRELIPLRELMQLDQYPKAQQISTFYAQSVALVEYLTKQKGPQVFTQFVRDALCSGYEAALKKHYGLQDFNDLQNNFTDRLLAELNSTQPAYVER